MTIKQALFFLKTSEEIKEDVSIEESQAILDWQRRRREAMAKEREAILAARAKASQEEKRED